MSSDKADQSPKPESRPRVLVLGGGFAGIGAARKLRKADVDVVVIDGHDYHTFQPLLYQVATGLLPQGTVGHPPRLPCLPLASGRGDEPVDAIAPQAELDPLPVHDKDRHNRPSKRGMNGWFDAAVQNHPPPDDAVSLNSTNP